MDSLSLNLLTDPLIRVRDRDGRLSRLALPELFAALNRDAIRDYPALRAHQRHPWHALLVQLAAQALHAAGEARPWDDASAWRAALLALSPEHPDGAAFCLISPYDRPAFLQPPVPDGKLDGWKSIATPDALDMLVTAKNHDLKSERMRQAEPDDWLFALTSLQTQEGFLGSGNYGISRMNGGFSNRPALGVVPPGGCGARWWRDIAALSQARGKIANDQELPLDGGIGLLWLLAWDGTTSLSFGALDPFYIEICRRIRLVRTEDSRLTARATGTKAARVEASARKGVTGDPWMPVDGEKALSLGSDGFSYRLAAELVWGLKYSKTVAQKPRDEDGSKGITLLAQGIARGQGKTEGYHERRIPILGKSVGRMRADQIDDLAIIAGERVQAIATMRGTVLRTALFVLFQPGRAKIDFDNSNVKRQVEPFLQIFERVEDELFFDDLNNELEAEKEDRGAIRLGWLKDLKKRAEDVLEDAFVAGPQCGERRYLARSRALASFHGALRNEKNKPLLLLVQALRSQTKKQEAAQ